MPERHLGQTYGRYRVEALVGSGGFAWVFRAFDDELEIPVALKILKPQFAGDPSFEERFRREASTAAKLRHPNIVKIFSVGRQGDAVYFAMDYLPTGLADRLEATNTVPEEVAIRVGMDVASALGFAHREGVIHRDIKVDNILFDAHGNAIVADFGIARAVSQYVGQTGTNMVVGTPQYFAPEQARAKPLDGRADIYSLGVTLYRSVAGRLPFEGDDWYEIARQHVEETPPPPTSFNPAIGAGLERVILHCLEKDPNDRPATGEALCQELAQVSQGTLDPITTARRTVPEATLMVRTPPGAADAGTAAAPGSSSGRSRGVVPVVLAASTLALAAMLFVPMFDRDATGKTDTGAIPDSSATVAVGDSTAALTPDSSAVSAVDSVADSVTRPTPPPPTHGRVVIAAPEDASVTVDGRVVGTGEFSDSLPQGRHTFVASVPAIGGCRTASVERVVRVRAGTTTRTALEPRPCGLLSIGTRQQSARYVLTSEGGETFEGSLPLRDPIMLPVGTYRLRVSARNCADFSAESLEITAAHAQTPRFQLANNIC